jgi:hypothetical protein
MNRRGIFVAVAISLGGTAFAYQEIVDNGGFETGRLDPWVPVNFYISGNSHSGSYGVYYYEISKEDPTELEAAVRQELGRTYYPEEVVSAELWFYFDPGSDRLGGVEFRLGRNYEARACYELERGWNEVEYNLNNVKAAFNYVFVYSFILMGWPPGMYNAVGVDDVSVLVSPTGIRATSLGRVKALCR